MHRCEACCCSEILWEGKVCKKRIHHREDLAQRTVGKHYPKLPFLLCKCICSFLINDLDMQGKQICKTSRVEADLGNLTAPIKEVHSKEDFVPLQGQLLAFLQ